MRVGSAVMGKITTKIKASAGRVALVISPTLLLGTMVGLRSLYYGGLDLAEGIVCVGELICSIACCIMGIRWVRRAWNDITPSGKRGVGISEFVFLGICTMFSTLFLLPMLVMPIGGPWVPRTEPSEDKRVFHPSGFSIISPPGWKIRIHTNPEAAQLLGYEIGMTPGDRSRYSPGLGAGRWFRQDDLTNYQMTVFRGKPAFEQTILGSGEYARLYYELLVPDGTNWFRLHYSKDAAFESPSRSNFPPIIRRYIESFRFPGEANVITGSAGKPQ